MKKIINLMKVSAVCLLAMSVQNCDDLLDALGDLTPKFVLGGTVTDTNGDGIDGATVTAYGLSTNSDALNEDQTVDINALSGGQVLTANSSGQYTGDVSIADVYVVIAEADCYSAVVEGVTDDRMLDENEAVTGAEGDVELDFTLGGGCGATTTGGGTASAAATDTGQSGGDFEITVNSGTTTVTINDGESNVVSIAGDYTGGTSADGLLVVDISTDGGTSYTRSTQAIELPLSSMSYAVVPGVMTRFSVGEGDGSGVLTSFSDYVTVDHQGTAADVTAILTWDGSGDVDFHATNLDDSTTIYYANKTEDWGSLDLDDTSGFGPETIQVTGAADYVKFSVYSWSCSEPVNVNVRIITADSDSNYAYDNWATECPTAAEDRWIEVGDFDSDGGR